ncbi:hypothetical protein Q7P36_001019 [Cladosporium allicinum]
MRCPPRISPVRHSSDHADLALAAGDGDIHLRDNVFVSNGLKALNIPPSSSLTILVASTSHKALPRNIMRTHSFPSILEIDIADVVRPSHQPTLKSPVAIRTASHMPGEASVPFMDWMPCW